MRLLILPTPQARASAADTAAAAVPVPEPTPLALRYHQSGTLLWGVSTLLGFLLPALILWTGLSARLRDLARRAGARIAGTGRWLPPVMLYGVLFNVLMTVLSLPLAYYVGFAREHAYGLSTQTRADWFGDWAKGLAVSCVLIALALPIPYHLLRRSPRRWWLYSGLSVLPLATLLLIVAPVWIDPLFDRFGPMENRALERRILALAERAGVEGSRVYQVDKSRETRTLNAYVTGVGATKRIVLWDTILARLPPRELLFVAGHELGHFVLRHTLAIILGATLTALLALYAVHRLAGRLLARYGRRFGFDRLDDVASVPLLVLLGGLVSFAATPAVLALTRHLEREADRFGLEITRDNRAAALAFVRLQQENLGVPRPGLLYTLWRGSHPSLAERIEFANRYRPWATGERLRYGHLFR